MRARVILCCAAAAMCGRAYAQDQGSVAVVEFGGGSYDRYLPDGITPNTAPREAVARQFYATHGDNYDFLIVFPAFAAHWGDFDGGGEAVGLNNPVRPSASGLGIPQFDVGASYGSANRLKSYIDVGSLRPGDPTFDRSSALGVIAHEVEHQFGVDVRYQDPASGQVSSALLGQESAHWSFFVDTDASVMFGSHWLDDGDGTFTSSESRKRYSELDLYLMGFLEPDEVAPFNLLTPAAGTPFTAEDLPPPDGTRISARATTVTVDQIVAAEGPRVPDAATAQHDFRAAFVLLVPAGTAPTQAQTDFVDQVRRQYENTFFFMTRGRGTMDTALVDEPPSQIASSPTINAGLNYLLSVQSLDGGWSDSAATALRDTEAGAEALSEFGTADSRIAPALAGAGGYLDRATPASLDDASRRVLGLRAAHLSADAALTRVLAAPIPGFGIGGGLGLAPGYGSTVIDTVLANLACIDASPTACDTTTLESYLATTQSAAGGWPLTEGGPPSMRATALALDLLARMPRTDERDEAAAGAAMFLRDARAPDGSFVDDGPSAASAAEALGALIAWKALSAEDVGLSASRLLKLQLSDGSWEESAFSTAEALKALRVALTPNLVLTQSDVQVSTSSAIDGQQVTATVTVHNAGYAEAQGVTVQAFDSSGVPFGPPQAIATLGVGASSTATLTLDTTGHGGSTQLFAVVDPPGNVDEAERDDNRAAVPLVIASAPAEPELYVTAGSLVAVPATLLQRPSDITVSAQVGNLGQTDAPAVTVVLLADGVQIASTQLDFLARGHQTISLSGTVPAGVTDANLQLVIDPAGLVLEPTKDDNSASLAVPLARAPDLVFSNYSADPAFVTQGAPVFIRFAVTNQGLVDATNSLVTVRVADLAGNVLASLPPVPLNIPHGQSGFGSLVWHADVSGDLIVMADASTANELVVTNNHAEAPVSVQPSPLVNLVIRPPDLKVLPSQPLEHQATTLVATITNSGASDAASSTVDFYSGDPATFGTRIASQVVPPIPAGGTATVTTTFVPQTGGTQIVTAVVDPQKLITEFDETDNQTVVTIDVVSLPDLVVSAADIALTPAFPRTGDSVAVTVTVANQGGQTASQVPVDLYLGDPASGGVSLGHAIIPSIEPGATQSTAFTWSTAGLQGPQQLFAVVNGDHSVDEDVASNDSASRSVNLQNADIALSEPYFSPNGDGVKDSTDLVLRVAGPSAAKVTITDPAGKLVRTIASSVGPGTAITWDGKDDHGRVVRDGPYSLIASVAQDGGASTLGPVTAVVDTNHSQFEDAVGTPMYEEYHLPPSFDAYEEVTPMPDDEGVVAYGEFPDPPCSGFDQLFGCEVDGIFRIPFDGSAPIRVTPESWEDSDDDFLYTLPVSSPDGSRIIYVAFISSSFAIRSVDVATGNVTTVVRFDPRGADFDTATNLAFTPDGNSILFVSDDWDSELRRIESVAVDGSNRQVIYTTPDELGFENFDFAISPTGDSVAIKDTDDSLNWVRIDGSARKQLLPPKSVTHTAERFFDGSDGRLAMITWADPTHVAFLSSGTPTEIFDLATCTQILCRGQSSCFDDDGWQSGPAVPTIPCTSFRDVGPKLIDVTSGAQSSIYSSSQLWASSGLGAGIATDPFGQDVAFDFGDGWNVTRQVWLTNLSTHTNVQLGLASGKSVDDVNWSPKGTFVIPNTEGDAVLRTLANLTTRLSVTRPDEGSVAFRATVLDANLQDYTLTVAPRTGGGSFVIAHEVTPARNAVIASWTPPQPGTWDATLVARDLAGNSRTRKASFVWSTTPAISNVTLNPKYVSPNGDQVQDFAAVTYTASQPESFEVQVADSNGAVVRRIDQTVFDAGDGMVIWDGRDDQGEVVADGQYTASLDGHPSQVTVDDTPPSVAAQLGLLSDGGDSDAGAAQFALGAMEAACYFQDSDQLIDITDTSLTSPTTGQGISVPEPETYLLISSQVEDRNLTNWRLEENSAASPSDYTTIFSSTDQHPELIALPVGGLTGSNHRVRAADLAGNVTFSRDLVHDERLFVIGSSVQDWVTNDFFARSYCILGGQRLPAWNLFVPTTLQPDGTALVTPFASRGRWSFAVENSISNPLVSLGIEVGDGDGGLVEQPVTRVRSGDHGDMLVWDTSGGGPVGPAVVHGVDSTGRDFYAPFVVPIGVPPTPFPTLMGCVSTSQPQEFDGQLDIDVGAPGAFEFGTSMADVGIAIYPFGKADAGPERDTRQPLTWLGAGAKLHPLDVSALQDCNYTIVVHDAHRADGGFLNSLQICANGVCQPGIAKAIDLCGMWLSDATNSADGTEITLAETYRKPISSVDILAGSPQQEIATSPAFDGTSPPVHADTQVLAACAEDQLQYRIHFSDGSSATFPDATAQQFCAAPSNSIRTGCAIVEAGPPSREGMDAACGLNASQLWSVPISAFGAVGALQSLTAELRSIDGLVDRPLLLDNLTLDAGSAVALATVDTSDLPEGDYTVIVTAVDTSGHSSTGQLVAPFLIPADRVAPVVSISDPSGVGAICPIARTDSSGLTKYEVDLSGHLFDSHLSTAEFAVAPSGGGDAIAQSSVPYGGAAVNQTGGLGSIDVGALSAGSYVLTGRAVDVSGNSTCFGPIPFELAGRLRITSAIASPSVFSPDHDGSFDTTSISLSADQSAAVVATIDGNQIGAASADGGPATLVWDGTAGGSAVADGQHLIHLIATDACGGTASTDLPIEIDTTPPMVGITSPMNQAPETGSFVVVGSVSDVHPDHWVLELGEGVAPTSFTTIATAHGMVSGPMATVQVSGLPTDVYTLRLTGFDSVGHSSVATSTFRYQPGAILSGASTSPSLISPNGDGLLDSSTTVVQLLQPASVSIDAVAADGGLAGHVVAATALSAGASSFTLDTLTLAAIPDGDYQLDVVATNGSQPESAHAALSIDRSAPAVTFDAPSGGAFVAGSSPASLEIDDPHLQSWTLTHKKPDGTSETVATGSQPQAGRLAVLAGLADGQHSLSVHAVDAAGNATDKTVSFTSDSTLPKVAFTSPHDGDVLSSARGPVAIAGEIQEANLDHVAISRIRDGIAVVLATLSSVPSGPLTSWDLSAEADGPVDLQIEAVDRAGNSAKAVIHVSIDSTPPLAHIERPRSSGLGIDGEFLGSVSDANLTTWKLAFGAQGGALAAIGSGTAPVNSGVLATLSPRPAAGTYLARLTATDKAGNTATDQVSFTVDDTPPGPPTGLVARVQNRRDVALTWLAPPDLDVVGYKVYRALGTAMPIELTSTPTTGLSYLDPGLVDGSYVYTVAAVDTAGNIGPQSGPAQVAIDTTPPSTSIFVPRLGAAVNGTVEVQGTAFSADDFKEYRLYIGAGAAPQTFNLIERSPQPIQGGTLGELDTTPLPQGSQQTLRLEAEDQTGNVGSTQVVFTVDNQAPAAPVLTSLIANGNMVDVKWQPNTEPDLAGYLLFRNGQLVNLPDGGDFTNPSPYLLPAFSTDQNDGPLPDGHFSYRLQAVDSALNVSALSAPLDIDLDAHPPSLTIDSPAPLSHLTGPSPVLASSPDLDVASVQFSARTDPGAAFSALSPPATAAPFRTSLDPAIADGGIVQVQAVATDRAGNTDPIPPTAVYFSEPPLAAPSASAHVDGSTVTLAWAPAADSPSIAGYELSRAGPFGPTSLVTATKPTGTVTASSGGGADAAIDGSLFFGGWTPAGDPPQWWQFDFDAPVVVDGIGISANEPMTITVSVKVGGFWTPIGPPKQIRTFDTSLAPIGPLKIEGVRLDISNYKFGFPGQIFEVLVHPAPVTQALSLTDSNVAPGNQTYLVTAVSEFGESAAQIATARVYAPVLAGNADAVPGAQTLVAGSNATPGATVTLSGGVDDVTAIADDAGNFEASVPLVSGANSIVAQAVDTLGNRSLPSAPEPIVYDPPPSGAIVLTEDGVAGSAVSMHFDVSGDLSNVAGFMVLRSDGTSTVAAGSLDGAARTFTDQGLRNGTYTYTVTAFNAHGFQGPPSNPITAMVQVQPPLAPAQLSVSAAPAGSELDLVWVDADSSASSFQVERALSQPGPFSSIAENVPGFRFADTGLSNGTTYYYRVSAIDSQGNVGPPSNVASGTPADTQPPSAPELDKPTVPGRPITVASATSTVSGKAELGSAAELFQNGVSLGTRMADGLATDALPLSTSRPIAGQGGGYTFSNPTCTPPGFPLAAGAAFSPNGNQIAYTFAPPDGSPLAVAIDGSSGTTVLSLAGVDLFGNPAYSPDGTRIAIQGLDRSSGCVHVYVGDARTTAVAPAVPNSTGQEFAPAWSTDGTRVAYEAVRTADRRHQLGVIAIGAASEVLDDLGVGLSAHQPTWADDAVIAVATPSVFDQVSHLTRFDPTSRAASDVLVATQISPAFAISHSGSTAAIAIQGQLTLVDLASGQPTSIPSIPSGAADPAFAPDDQMIALLVNGTLNFWSSSMGDVATAFRSLGSGALAWSTPTRLLFSSTGGTPQEFAMRGRFTFNDVPLQAGSNVFVARATDAAGNVGAFGEPIEVDADASALADLAVGVVVQPSTTAPGTPTNAVVTVTNIGQAAALQPGLSAELITSSGEVRDLGSPTLGLTLAPGDSAGITLPIDVSGLTGTQTVIATVDPSGAIPDSNLANNHARTTFDVVSHLGIALSAAISPAAVAANGAAVLSVAVTNTGADTPLVIHNALEDLAGNLVVDLGDQSYSDFAAGFEDGYTRTVQVGTVLAGNYQVTATAVWQGLTLASASAPLVVEPDRNASVTLTADRAFYRPGDPIGLSTTVTNASSNALLTDAGIETSILDAQGDVLADATLQLPALAPGVQYTSTTSMAPSLAPGSYQARAQLLAGGAVAATAAASIQVIGAPTLTGTLAVTGGAGQPPAIRQGTPATVTYSVANSGSAPANDVFAHLALVDPADQSIVASFDSGPFTLDVGGVSTNAASFDTSQLGLRSYSIVLTASHDSLSPVELAQTRIQILDSQPPVLSFVNLTDQMFVRDAVLVRVHASDTGSGTSQVSISIDNGAPQLLTLASGTPTDGEWSGTAALSSEGPHLIAAFATDFSGNDGQTTPTSSNPVSLTVIRDTLPPVIAIAGVSQGELAAMPLSPTVQITDGDLAGATVLLDGQPFVSGTAVSTDGDHLLAAQAVDAAGNTATAQVSFSIDQSPPRISIAGVVDGEVTQTNVTPTVLITDPHLANSSILLDGAAYISGTPVTAEGRHALDVQASDSLGHSSSASAHFTIDRTAPTVALGGFSEGEFVNTPVTPTFTATDANLASVAATLNALPFISGTPLTADGSYALVVTAFDLAGLSTTRTGSFTIDTIPPRIDLTPANGTCTSHPVTAEASISDLHLLTSSVTLNGAPLVSGTPVDSEGSYLLDATADDAATNHSEKQSRFTIDTTPPQVSIGGLDAGSTDGGEFDAGLYFRTAVNPTVEVVETNLVGTAVTLNDAPFTPGTPITAEGAYVLYAKATDCAGQFGEATEAFHIDLTPPAIAVGGFVDGEVVAAAVTPVFSATDASPFVLSALLNGAAFASGTAVTADGRYRLVLSALDAAGNASASSGGFTIDTTPPRIAVSGVTDGEYSTAPVTPTIDVEDANPGTTTTTLDGQPFVSGTSVVGDGDYLLQVSSVDLAGNRSDAGFAFTIDGTPPTVAVSGVTDGTTYFEPVTPVVTFSDAHLASTEITMDGQPFTSGTQFAEPGPHVLVASATDRGGLSNTVTVHFTLEFVRVSKRIPTRFTRAAALLTSGDCSLAAGDYARLSGFLNQAIGGTNHILAITGDPNVFETWVRSGHYNLFILASLADASSNGSCSEATQPAGSDPAVREITELVFSGRAGLVDIRTRTENAPKLREVLGIDLWGQPQGTTVHLDSSALTPLADLTTGGSSARLKLGAAALMGEYLGGTGPTLQPAVARYGFGQGVSWSFGFDLSVASASSDALLALQRAVEDATPFQGGLDALAVAPVEIALSNPSTADVDVRVLEALPAPLFAVDAAPPPTWFDGGAGLSWETIVPAGRDVSLDYLAQLPEMPGSYSVVSDVDAVTPGGVFRIGTYPLTLAVTRSDADLFAAAQSAAAALPAGGRDRPVSSRIQAALAAVGARTVSSRADIEQNLSDLLGAVDQSKRLTTVDPTAMRMSLDDLVRYWEARWYAY